MGSVHLQNGWEPTDPLGETRWLEQVAFASGRPDAIVGYADLAFSRVAELLASHAAHSGFAAFGKLQN